jgi:hypothetical protein
MTCANQSCNCEGTLEETFVYGLSYGLLCKAHRDGLGSLLESDGRARDFYFEMAKKELYCKCGRKKRDGICPSLSCEYEEANVQSHFCRCR